MVFLVFSGTKSNMILPIWKRICEERPPRLMGLISQDFGKFFYMTKGEQDTWERDFLYDGKLIKLNILYRCHDRI